MKRLLVLAAALGLPYAALALDPHKALTQYSQTRWTQQQGLPQDAVGAIAQTADGYLWLGTNEGLARFDGYEFVTFRKSQNGLLANSIAALASAADGSLWIGTRQGLTQYREGHFRNWTSRDGLADDSVTALFVDHAGIVWAVAGGNLSRFDGARFTNYVVGKDLPMTIVQWVTEDRDHKIYVAGHSAVCVLNGERCVPLVSQTAFATVYPDRVAADRKGNIWVAGYRHLAVYSPASGVRIFGTENDLQSLVNDVLEDRDGNIWLATTSGLARMKDGRIPRLPESGADTTTSVRSLFEDREGNLWAGTSDGLVRFRDDVFTVYGRAEGLPSDEPETVFQDHAGRTWAGFRDHGLVLVNGSAGPLPPASRLPRSEVLAIRETRDYELIVASRDGLTRIRDGAVTTFVPPDSQNRKSVFDTIGDRAGRIWLASADGLGLLENGRYRLVIPGSSSTTGSPTILQEAPDGTLWAGSAARGLWHIEVQPRGDKKTLYRTSDGLSSDQIRSLLAEPDGTLWIGTLEAGLTCLRGGKFTRFSARDGLLSDSIVNILDDGDALWLSTPRGISRIPKKQFLDFAAHRIPALQPVNYGIADGLRSADCSSVRFGAGGSRNADGSLWFATSRGIAVFQRDAARRRETAPLVHLTEAAIDATALDLTGRTQVPPGAGRMQIRYTAIHLRAPEQVRFFYKLAGLDADWVPAGARRTANYNSLGRGRYIFQVRAELPGGPASESSGAFEILPHFWETIWFRLLMLLALAGMVWGAFRLRMWQVRSRFGIVLNERERLAREIHDTLAQSFVGISSQLDAAVTFLPESATPARICIDLARKMARHSLTEARRSVMDLRAALLDNQDLAAALESGVGMWTAGTGIDASVAATHPSGPLSKDVEQHVFRIAQEAVTNVVKHAHAKKIDVTLDIQPRKLNLTIADDGCGFDEGQAFASARGHFGLIGMRERAKRLRGDLRLESHAGGGTRVEVEVPLG